MSVFAGIILPLIGTSLGAACVFFLKNDIRASVQKALLGFASGIMVAASVWSLLIPAMDMAEPMGSRMKVVPAVVGFLLGIGFILFLDSSVPHQHIGCEKAEGCRKNWSRTTKLLLAVTLHNIPEGMAVGVVFSGMLADSAKITLAGAFALSVGIAVQNFPEGAIISMPLRSESNMNRGRAFVYGVLSGVVEPVAAGLTILLSDILIPVLPYLLSFAAGAMIYVVVEELIPEANEGEHSNVAAIGFAAGFSIMMILDVVLG